MEHTHTNKLENTENLSFFYTFCSIYFFFQRGRCIKATRTLVHTRGCCCCFSRCSIIVNKCVFFGVAHLSYQTTHTHIHWGKNTFIYVCARINCKMGHLQLHTYTKTLQGNKNNKHMWFRCEKSGSMTAFRGKQKRMGEWRVLLGDKQSRDRGNYKKTDKTLKTPRKLGKIKRKPS